MRKLFSIVFTVAGALTLLSLALLLAATMLPNLPASERLRARVANAALEWATSARQPHATSATHAGAKQLYQCAMHPQIVSEEPGLCPICQMRLEPVIDAGAHKEARRPKFYRHPMRPDVVSPEPAKDEMGMDYIPVYATDETAGASNVPGRAPFTLSAERQQLIGVRRAKLERRDLKMEIRAVGKVAYDPGLFETIVEYQQAVAGRRRLATSQSSEALAGADALVRAAALKLRQLGLSEQQLRRVAEEGRAPRNLLLPGDSAWVYAQVYEYELELVRPGQSVVVTAPSLPGRTWNARVVAIDPIITAASRTARVRVEVSTPAQSLRPETFVNVTIQVPSENHLAIPEEAVLDTGDHRTVFVVSGEGRFEPRSVELGRLAQGYYEVLSGLSEGEEVVTSANFLIDSESRFRSAVAAFTRDASADRGGKP